MARFSGVVGFGGDSVETPDNSGVYVDQITERTYYGDVNRNVRNNIQNPDKVNEDISVSNTISIVADQHAIENFINIKYVGWAGVLWTVSSVDIQSPRLILNLGEVYNGPTAAEE